MFLQQHHSFISNKRSLHNLHDQLEIWEHNEEKIMFYVIQLYNH